MDGVGQVDDHLGVGREIAQRAIEEPVGAEVLDPRHPVPEGDQGFPGGVGGLGKEVLRPESDQRAAVLEEVHGRRAEEAGDERVGGLVVDFLRLSQLADLAGVHHRDPVAQAHRLHLVVRHVDGGRSEAPLELLQFVARQIAQLGVEVTEGLVEEEHVRLADHRPRERDALPLSAGKLARLALEQPVDAEHRGRLAHALVDGFRVDLLRLEGEGDVLLNRHVRVQRVALEDHRDLALARRQIVHHAVADDDVAGGLLLEPGDHAEQGRLPAAGRTEQDEELSFASREVDAVDRGVLLEDLADRLRLDRRHLPSPVGIFYCVTSFLGTEK